MAKSFSHEVDLGLFSRRNEFTNGLAAEFKFSFWFLNTPWASTIVRYVPKSWKDICWHHCVHLPIASATAVIMGIAYVTHCYRQTSWDTLIRMEDIACDVRRHRSKRHIRSEYHKSHTREWQSTVENVGGLRKEKDRAQSNGKKLQPGRWSA